MSFHYISVTIQEQGLKTKTVCFLLGFPICSPSLAQTPRTLMPSLIKCFSVLLGTSSSTLIYVFILHRGGKKN